MILTRTICEIKGTGDFFCPVCGERLYHYDSRKRKAINLDGEKEVFLLRRLRCTNCHKIHLELPDFLIPCKRYFKEIIVDLLNGEDNPVPYDSSVRNRIKSWFNRRKEYFENALQSLAARNLLSPDFRNFPILNFARELVNYRLWPFHPIRRIPDI